MPGIGLPELPLIFALLVGMMLILRAVSKRTHQPRRISDLERGVAELRAKQK
ncbi:hypothetical protein [Deinococcus cavernae]|uniref:hypothetical protein n=1 Tax=Deinococcus cavernae TaxID=2320857 RepID=UPI001313EE1C|nr:hypothetical protein [Deinococcus cavernae]